jgi:hypothetical protein
MVEPATGSEYLIAKPPVLLGFGAPFLPDQRCLVPLLLDVRIMRVDVNEDLQLNPVRETGASGSAREGGWCAPVKAKPSLSSVCSSRRVSGVHSQSGSWAV